MRRVILVVSACLSVGCSPSVESSLSADGGVGATEMPEPPDAAGGTLPPDGVVLAPSSGPWEVEIGTPGGVTGFRFEALPQGGIVPIGGVGQAGLTARFAVRAKAADLTELQDASVRLEIDNIDDATRDPGVNNTADARADFRCSPDGWCYLVPLLVEITHLNKLPELEGTRITIDVTVQSLSSAPQRGSTSSWGELRRAE